MTIRLIVARHGNTFEENEIPRRIGARTDLDLTETGRKQGTKIGAWLRENEMMPHIIYASRLKRTRQTAEAAQAEMGLRHPIHQSDMFDEIDYGPDENKTDPDVVARIGGHAFTAWEKQNAMPRDWSPQPDVIRRHWYDFANHCEKNYDNKNVLVVTSNGVARFLPLLARNGADIVNDSNRKMATGGISILEGSGGLWMISHWNTRP